MPQEWHDRSYWSVMLQTVPEAAELFCNVRLCFVTLSSPAERFPAANGRLGLQRSIWPDPSYRKVGSTAKKWQDVATLPSHTSRSTLTPFHWKWINVSAVSRKKIPKFFFFFFQMQLTWQLPMFCLMSSYLCEEWLGFSGQSTQPRKSTPVLVREKTVKRTQNQKKNFKNAYVSPRQVKNKSPLLLCACLEGQMPDRAHPTKGQGACTHVLFMKIIAYTSISTGQLYTFTSPTISPWKWTSSVPVEAKISPRSRLPCIKICHENQGQTAKPRMPPIFLWKLGFGNNRLLAKYRHVSNKFHGCLGLWAKIFKMGSETPYQY